MNIQELIRSADSEKVDQYLWWARLQPCDPDKADMTEMIIEMGLTPYQAARRRADSGATNRSFKTLYYHARVIVQDLYEHLGESVQDRIRELQMTRETHCAPDQIQAIREACEHMGFEIEEDIRVRLVERKVGRNWREVKPDETGMEPIGRPKDHRRNGEGSDSLGDSQGATPGHEEDEEGDR